MTMNRRELIGALTAITTSGAAASLAGKAGAQEPLAASARPAGSMTGARNLITDVAGLRVGQANDPAIATGVTVVLPDEAAIAACDVRGGGPASRETDVLAAENLVQKVDAIVFSGGSVYGLGSADGITAWMGARNRGFSFRRVPGVPPSPILPTACLFDLANGGNKDWGEAPPYRRLGIEALESAAREFELGTAGAGFGANSGGLKGGIGSASVISDDGTTVGALVAVNSMGSAIAPGSKAILGCAVRDSAMTSSAASAPSELKGEPERYRGRREPA